MRRAYRSKHSIRVEKRITSSHCKEHSIFEIILVLRDHNNSPLWDIPKPEWTIENWRMYLELKNKIE